MFCNLNDENEIIHLCLIANEGVKNHDTIDNDNDDDSCTSDDEEKEEKTEYDNPDGVYDFLNNYSRCKLIKVLLYYIRHQEGQIAKIKD